MSNLHAPPGIDADIAAIGRIEAVPTMLRVFCETTGISFAAVARVTDASWTACAIQDNIRLGLCAGGELDVDTTLCKEVRQARAPIVIERASTDPVYRGHHTPRLYGIESYLSVPIVRPGLALLDEREAGELREQFIAVLGHDLRNPLAAISACGQLIERQPGDPSVVVDAATRIGNNVRRMSALIDDVLDLARGRLGGGFVLSLATAGDLGARSRASSRS